MSTPRRRPLPYARPEAGAPAPAAAGTPTAIGTPAPPGATGTPAPPAATGTPAPPAATASAPAARTGRPERPARSPQDTEPTPRRFDPTSWPGALVLILAFVAVLWIVQIANAADDYGFNRFGLKPRRVDGLWGVLTQPFLEVGYSHMGSNTLPLVLIGWVVMLAGPRVWAAVSAFIVVVGGALTWVFGPSHELVVGASGLVFGWIGYLIARAIFSRRIRWILSAVAVLVIFGTLLANLVPSLHADEAWQSHVTGFAAGVVIGAILHPRGAELRRFRRPRNAA